MVDQQSAIAHLHNSTQNSNVYICDTTIKASINFKESTIILVNLPTKIYLMIVKVIKHARYLKYSTSTMISQNLSCTNSNKMILDLIVGSKVVIYLLLLRLESASTTLPCPMTLILLVVISGFTSLFRAWNNISSIPSLLLISLKLMHFLIMVWNLLSILLWRTKEWRIAKRDGEEVEAK